MPDLARPRRRAPRGARARRVAARTLVDHGRSPGSSACPPATGRFVLAARVCVVAGVLVAGLIMPLVGRRRVVARRPASDFENLPSVLAQPVLPAADSTILAADGSSLATIYSQNRVDVPLAADQPAAAEGDRRHRGLPVLRAQRRRPPRPVRALVSNAQGGDGQQGGSTLTQQYVKNVLVLTATNDAGAQPPHAPTHSTASCARRGYAHRAREASDQGADPRGLPQHRVLRRRGVRRRGAAAALLRRARDRQLTLAQAATLAGIVQSPVSYDPIAQPAGSRTQRGATSCSSGWYQLGVITDATTARPADDAHGEVDAAR